MKQSIEKELRDLWKSIRSKHEPFPNASDDIEEFLNAGEWGLALEHIIDWAKAEKKHKQAEAKIKHIKALMKQLSAKKTD